MNLFRAITEDLNRYLLASHMPQGKLWESCFIENTNLGKLIQVLSIEYYRTQLLIDEFSNEMDIRKTISFIEEWEESVGIPNSCLSVKGVSLEQRRSQIEGVFGNFGGVQKAEAFERVALLFGFTVTVLPGNSLATTGVFPLEFPATFGLNAEQLSHTIIVNLDNDFEGDTFPFDFAFSFGTQSKSFLQCIFDMLAPANVIVMIKLI